ncbi:MAG: hypothetical protein HY071_02780 [Chloroflexi bacterium]|nr:hypothetical protein [Chloroflexota bacterium]
MSDPADRDLLVLAKTIAANEFPVERPSVVGVDRETGGLLRLTPFPWKGNDSDPPVQRWTWLHASAGNAPRDPRRDSREVSGELLTTAYVDAKDGWRLRRPFIRPLERGSLEELQSIGRAGGPTLGIVVPSEQADVLQLPLRLRFRCADEACTTAHDLPVLDWELHEMARVTRERHGARWATRFRETWGAALFARYDVRLVVSAYAQSPAKHYVAAVIAVPKELEDAHEHLHHTEHRKHLREGGAAAS